ncbi:MAG: hypothetical protein LBR93_04030 [Treponema sp.]|jgi:hypothetical protein|nr:hypothetical protein [Treponema sp.]
MGRIDMRLNTVVLKAIALLMLCHTVGGLYAQAEETEEPYIRIVTIPQIKVHVAPLEGGTEEETRYFKENFEMELIGAAYAVAETREESDFYMTLSVAPLENEGEEDPSKGLDLTLFNTRTGQTIITLNWAYTELSEMSAWNLWLIYQAMANAPVVKVLNNAELTGVPAGNWPRDRAAGDAGGEKEPHKISWYAGLRAGGVVGLYTFQTTRGYEGGIGHSFTGEAALFVEFHPFRYVSFQAEGVVVYDSFGWNREIQQGEGEAVTRSGATFSALSLHIPLLVKAPLSFGRFSVSPLAGFYFVLPLGSMSGKFGDSAESYSYHVDPPLGISFGADLALSFRSGKAGVGLRYDLDLGATIGEAPGPVYSRDRLGFSLGYAWRIGRGRS